MSNLTLVLLFTLAALTQAALRQREARATPRRQS